MQNNWQGCKNILCIRPDNMGDLIMTGPALRAIKTSFNCQITVLTSSMAAKIAELMPEVDDVLIADLPWVKTSAAPDEALFNKTVAQIKSRRFDAAVIFTVYSQNPLPTVMLAYLAGIPKRLAYCRENPYQLLTDWVPDPEPYQLIKHQVIRDLDLVASVGAAVTDNKLRLNINDDLKNGIGVKLKSIGVDTEKPWLLIHPGVSELKREYPPANWIKAGKKLITELGVQLLITGSAAEKELTEIIQKGIGNKSYAAGGLFNLNELVALISMAPVLIAVNTGTVHIAAAVGIPVVVLYALTNPQHTPWQVPHKVLPFTPAEALQSKNEIIRFVNRSLYTSFTPLPDEHDITQAVSELLTLHTADVNPLIKQLPGRLLTESRVFLTN